MNEVISRSVNNWKKMYSKIFIIKIKGEEYVYRILDVKECETILNLNEIGRECDVADIALSAVIYPLDFNVDNVSIDVSNVLSECILQASRVFEMDGIRAMIDEARAEAESNLSKNLCQWKLGLMQVFPGYKLADFDDMPIYEFFKLLMMAEKLTNKKFIDYKALSISAQQQTRQPVAQDDIKQQLQVGDKFMSKSELEQLAADEAMHKLREHWKQHRSK